MSVAQPDDQRAQTPTMREIDLSAIRERVVANGGKTWWRGLDELADTPEFREMLDREFLGRRRNSTIPSRGGRSSS